MLLKVLLDWYTSVVAGLPMMQTMIRASVKVGKSVSSLLASISTSSNHLLLISKQSGHSSFVSCLIDNEAGRVEKCYSFPLSFIALSLESPRSVCLSEEHNMVCSSLKCN